MPSARVLVSDLLDEGGLAALEQTDGIDVDYRPGISGEEMLTVIGEYDALIVRSATKVDADLLDAAERLRVVGRAGIGLDNIDVRAASRRGVVVMNTPTGNAVTTAEHALSLMMALARNLVDATASMREGRWDDHRFVGTELWGKTLGIVGLGNVGKIIAGRARGLHMALLAYDPYASDEKAREIGVSLVRFEELLARSHFVTIHAPLTDRTENLFNAETLGRMRSGSYLVNTAIGGIIDENALIEAVQSGPLKGAALDVFREEPLPADSPLRRAEGILCTPHMGASTAEAQGRVAAEIAEQVRDFLQEGVVRNAVNMPAIGREQAARAEPYWTMARKIGQLLAQLEKVIPREIRVTCTGEAGTVGVTTIAHAAVAGYLEGVLDESVSPLNASFEAEQRAIEIVEVQEMTSRYAATVRVSVTGEEGVHTATGSVGVQGEPRLVGLEGYDIDAVMEGTAIVARNADKPGVIGAMGTVLADHAINVSRMQVGLDESTGQALAVWLVDCLVPESVLNELRSLQHVYSVVSLTL